MEQNEKKQGFTRPAGESGGREADREDSTPGNQECNGTELSQAGTLGNEGERVFLRQVGNLYELRVITKAIRDDIRRRYYSNPEFRIAFP